MRSSRRSALSLITFIWVRVLSIPIALESILPAVELISLNYIRFTFSVAPFSVAVADTDRLALSEADVDLDTFLLFHVIHPFPFLPI